MSGWEADAYQGRGSDAKAFKVGIANSGTQIMEIVTDPRTPAWIILSVWLLIYWLTAALLTDCADQSFINTRKHGAKLGLIVLLLYVNKH